MEKKLSIFECYITAWVVVCIVGRIFLVKVVPNSETVPNDFLFVTDDVSHCS